MTTSSDTLRWLAALTAAVCLLSVACIAHGQAAGTPETAALTGTRLADYLEALRAEGLTVIYSSTLVPDSLRIESEPIGATPRIRLTSVLSRLGLALERGPRETWLIVRGAAPPDALEPRADTPVPAYVPPPLENVIVTASRYDFAREPAASGSFVDRVQLENVPAIGDDALRPLANVPGVSSNGLSGRMAVRGGNTDETLILLDGVELSNPFHLKDFESIFGSISPRAIDRMNVYTGGFSARYGGRMSGVVEMQTMTPQEQRHFEIGISTINSSLLSAGRFDDDDGDWLVSLRRGTVDLLLDAADSDFGSPQFGDFLGRISHRIGDSGELRFGLLSLNDKLSLSDGPETRADADYDDNYIWAGFSHDLSRALSGDYTLWFANIDSIRDGATNIPDVSIGRLNDRRSQSHAAFRGIWRYRPGERHFLEWGLQAAAYEAQFAFASSVRWPYPVGSPLPTAGPGDFVFADDFEDTRSSLFLSYRYRVNDALTLELGTRADSQSIVDERELSPRFGAVWDLGDRVSIRASWGQFTQPRGIDELQFSDRDTAVYRSQKSEQSVVSLEFDPNDNTRLRLEVFDKDFTRTNPRFENLFTRLSLLPELLPDRVQLAPVAARARGVEISLDADLPNWRWWVSYSRAEAEDEIDGQWIRRSWQESWAAKTGFIWMKARWNIAATLLARAGWPISVPEVDAAQIVVRGFNDRAFESFRSLDVKATRVFDLRRGDLELYAELINVFDANNKCCYEHSVTTAPGGGVSELQLDTQSWLPGVPVIGLLWEF